MADESLPNLQWGITEDIASKMTPAQANKIIKGLVLPHAMTAVRTLVEICDNRRMMPMARVAAAKLLLDRGFGKPETTLPVHVNPNSSRTGIALIPSAGNDSQWLQKASAHHQKMLK